MIAIVAGALVALLVGSYFTYVDKKAEIAEVPDLPVGVFRYRQGKCCQSHVGKMRNTVFIEVGKFVGVSYFIAICISLVVLPEEVNKNWWCIACGAIVGAMVPRAREVSASSSAEGLQTPKLQFVEKLAYLFASLSLTAKWRRSVTVVVVTLDREMLEFLQLYRGQNVIRLAEYAIASKPEDTAKAYLNLRSSTSGSGHAKRILRSKAIEIIETTQVSTETELDRNLGYLLGLPGKTRPNALGDAWQVLRQRFHR